MPRTAMPKAAINEDGDLGTLVRDVRSSGKAADVSPEARAASPKGLAQSQFRLGVSAADL
jgi:hypothetical protein